MKAAAVGASALLAAGVSYETVVRHPLKKDTGPSTGAAPVSVAESTPAQLARQALAVVTQKRESTAPPRKRRDATLRPGVATWQAAQVAGASAGSPAVVPADVVVSATPAAEGQARPAAPSFAKPGVNLGNQPKGMAPAAARAGAAHAPNERGAEKKSEAPSRKASDHPGKPEEKAPSPGSGSKSPPPDTAGGQQPAPSVPAPGAALAGGPPGAPADAPGASEDHGASSNEQHDPEPKK
jgi:hypothetical protein